MKVVSRVASISDKRLRRLKMSFGSPIEVIQTLLLSIFECTSSKKKTVACNTNSIEISRKYLYLVVIQVGSIFGKTQCMSNSMAKFQGHLAVIQLVCSRASKTSDTTRKLHHNCKCPIFTSKGTDTSLLIWKLNLKTGYTKN